MKKKVIQHSPKHRWFIVASRGFKHTKKEFDSEAEALEYAKEQLEGNRLQGYTLSLTYTVNRQLYLDTVRESNTPLNKELNELFTKLKGKVDL